MTKSSQSPSPKLKFPPQNWLRSRVCLELKYIIFFKFLNKQKYSFFGITYDFHASCIMGHWVKLKRKFRFFLEVGKYLPEIYSLTDFTITRNICFPQKSFLIWFAQSKCCSQCEPQGHSVQHSAALKIEEEKMSSKWYKMKTLYFSDLLRTWPMNCMRVH